MKTKILFTTILTSVFFYSKAQTWSQLTCGTDFVAAHNFAVFNNKLYVGKGSDKVYSSTDGSTWASSSTGITNGYGLQALYEFGGALYAGISGNYLYTSTDGSNWTSIPASNTTGNITAIYKSGSTLLYGTNSSSGVRMSTDNGANWTISSGSSSKSLGYNFVEHNGKLFVSAYNDVLKSTDNGTTWTALSISIGSATSMSLASTGNSLLLSVYSGTDNGVYRSTDDGATWTKVLSGAINRVQYINGVAFAGGAQNMSNNTVFKSVDNGATWTNITGTGIFNGAIVQSFALFNNKLFVGTHYYVYSTDFIVGTDSLPEIPADLVLSTHPSSPLVITLDWTDNSLNELGFVIQRSNDSINWNTIDSVGANTPSYTDSFLTANNTYYYRVFAYNNVGNSDFSNVVSRSTLQGINENKFDRISIYPNPTIGSITIKGENLENEEILIFNSIGNLVYHNKYYQDSIDISTLPNGIYWIQINMYRNKIIKN